MTENNVTGSAAWINRWCAELLEPEAPRAGWVRWSKRSCSYGRREQFRGSAGALMDQSVVVIRFSDLSPWASQAARGRRGQRAAWERSKVDLLFDFAYGGAEVGQPRD